MGMALISRGCTKVLCFAIYMRSVAVPDYLGCCRGGGWGTDGRLNWKSFGKTIASQSEQWPQKSSCRTHTAWFINRRASQWFMGDRTWRAQFPDCYFCGYCGWWRAMMPLWKFIFPVAVNYGNSHEKWHNVLVAIKSPPFHHRKGSR